jgi:hypothetical protein
MASKDDDVKARVRRILADAIDDERKATGTFDARPPTRLRGHHNVVNINNSTVILIEHDYETTFTRLIRLLRRVAGKPARPPTDDMD